MSDWAVPPGRTIAIVLEERKISPQTFADKLDVPKRTVEELLSGRVTITEALAARLQKVVGGSVNFWLSRERQYRESLIRIQEYRNSTKSEAWLWDLPVKDMVKMGWIDSVASTQDKIAQCLRFFGVPNVQAWTDAYRSITEFAAFRTSKSLQSEPGAVAVWLRKGELDANPHGSLNWDLEKFRSILPKLRELTLEAEPKVFLPVMKSLCAGCGVLISIVPTPKGCRASGAVRFLENKRVNLLLSFRYLSDDHFWFTFFHEAGHLILHQQKRFFVEGVSGGATEDEENEANEFAASTLIPKDFRYEFHTLPSNYRSILRFAHKIQIAPGVVLGQLQHLGRVKQQNLNKLKVRYRWNNPD